jgi:hypothetical protein
MLCKNRQLCSTRNDYSLIKSPVERRISGIRQTGIAMGNGIANALRCKQVVVQPGGLS